MDTDRSCLITGATGGLGQALADTFCAAGFHTLVSGRDAAALHALVGRLRPAGRAVPFVADLAEPADIRRLAAEVSESVGRLDVLIANAGQTVQGGFVAADEPLERWRDMVLVNVFGTAAVLRATLPMLIAAQGTVVFVGSVTGRHVVPGDLYSVTKHAVSALAEAVRLELEETGVRVCLVQPGLIDTPMVSGVRRTRPMIDPARAAAEILRLVTMDLQVSEMVLRPWQRQI